MGSLRDFLSADGEAQGVVLDRSGTLLVADDESLLNLLIPEFRN